jgi:hypothetical protein
MDSKMKLGAFLLKYISPRFYDIFRWPQEYTTTYQLPSLSTMDETSLPQFSLQMIGYVIADPMRLELYPLYDV